MVNVFIKVSKKRSLFPSKSTEDRCKKDNDVEKKKFHAYFSKSKNPAPVNERTLEKVLEKRTEKTNGESFEVIFPL